MKTTAQVIADSQASISKNDLKVLFSLLNDFKCPSVVLEIGMHLGHSMEVWYEAFGPTWQVGVDFGNEPVATRYDDKTNFITIWKRDSHLDKTMEGVKMALDGRLVEFLFIDGDHSYEGVKKDFEMYSQLLAEHAIVVFHDVVYTAFGPDVQVKPFWEEIKAQAKDKNWTWVELRSPDSTGMGVLFT